MQKEMGRIPDDFWLRSSIIQKNFRTKNAPTSIVELVLPGSPDIYLHMKQNIYYCKKMNDIPTMVWAREARHPENRFTKKEVLPPIEANANTTPSECSRPVGDGIGYRVALPRFSKSLVR